LQPKVPVTFFPADLAQSGGRKVVVEKIQQYTPDLCINTAGFGLYGGGLDYLPEQELEILTVNGSALLEFTLATASTLQAKNKKGVICNVASAIAFHLAPYIAVYAASKAFAVHVSGSLDLELEPKGIRVLTACPGMVQTQFANRAGADPTKMNQSAMTPQFAAEEIWWQIQRGKRLHIFDWKYRWGTFLSRFLPKKFVGNIIGRNIRSRL
jgi:uncharacterized protein